MLFVAKAHPPKKRAASGGKSKCRRTGSSRPRPRGTRAEDAAIEDLGGSLADYASPKDMKRELDRTRAEADEILDPDFAKPAGVIKRRTRRPLMDFAGILSPKAAEELREAIEEARKERKPLDRERLKRLMEALDRLDDIVVLETAHRKAKAAGLTRNKVRDLLDEVKKEVWNQTYGDKSPRK